MNKDKEYLEIFLEPVRKCMSYKPKFGNSKKTDGYSYSDFSSLYGSDPFYAWIGLNTELMYSAHKAAGGMTSVYRQIGIGCERLFREIIIDSTKYENRTLAEWSYEAKTQSGKSKKLSLDGRLELTAIRNESVKTSVESWIKEYCSSLDGVQTPTKGIVFEVRQGYKSKDSKRQNADIDNATVAWSNGYLPVFAVFFSQIDMDIVLRYRNNRCGVLVGLNNDDTYTSLYKFSKEILKYDLAGFFERNSQAIKKEVHSILEVLLRAD